MHGSAKKIIRKSVYFNGTVGVEGEEVAFVDGDRAVVDSA